jgi:hypothetical protein
VDGLKVLKDVMWIPVPHLPDAILVILSDQTEVIYLHILYAFVTYIGDMP